MNDVEDKCIAPGGLSGTLARPTLTIRSDWALPQRSDGDPVAVRHFFQP